MDRLREPLAEMFKQFRTGKSAKQEIANSVLKAIGFKHLVQALPHLNYFDPRTEDDWFIDALLGGKGAPLICNSILKFLGLDNGKGS
jgi:hypothetical protein